MSTGRSLPHDSGPLHVSGAARYADDIPLPANTVHLAFGLASIAKGTITGIDLAAVRAAPGVIAVWSAEDFEVMPDCSPSAHDEPLLATGQVHYHGQPVFLVVAESHLAARKAARLGQITYDEAKPILTIDEALAANSRFEEAPLVWQRGELSVLETTAHRLQGQIEIGGQEHFYLEGQTALAEPEDHGGVHIWSSTQHPTEIQHKVAHALHLKMAQVRVETRRMGGGFGGKESQGNALAIACAVAAHRLNRPAKMRYDRDDDMVITGKRHDFRITYDVGFDDDGHILAISFHQYARCGWSQDLSLAIADRAMLHADNAYYLPNVRIESHRLKTNTASATAFRGFGGPQGMLGIERVVDHIAHHLKRDPVSIRRVNFYSDGEAAAPTGGIRRIVVASKDRHRTHYGMQVEDFILKELVMKLEETSDYQSRRKAVAAWNAQNQTLKRGISCTPVKFGISFTLTHLNQAGALVHVYADGSVHVNHGGTEMGQGLNQKVAQVAAKVFGLPMNTIQITPTDTGKVPNTSATAASSGSDMNGMAVKLACEEIRDRMSVALGGPGDFEAGRVAGDAYDYSFAEAAKRCHMARISLSATGYYATPKLVWDRIAGQGRPFYYFAYGAAVTEVVIDTLTGENRILRTDILHDVGRALNPAIDIGQIEGGFVQGAGWLTCEELVWDDHGRLRTHAPSTYKIPAVSDRPAIFNVKLWDGENREETVYRSKAVGEPPLMLGISAFLAISDAIASVTGHYPSLDAPATPERILMALRS
jgi:xanthine dehydrogenase large subunit